MRSPASTEPQRRGDARHAAAPRGAGKMDAAADAITRFVRNLGHLERVAADAGAKPDRRTRPA